MPPDTAIGSDPVDTVGIPGPEETRPRQRLRNVLSRTHLGYVACCLLAALAVLFLIAPAILAVVVSFGASQFPTFPNHGWSVHWYADIGVKYADAAVMSVKVALVATAVSLLLGLPAAMVLSRSGGRSAAAIGALVRSPLQVPYVVIGVALLQYFSALYRVLGLSLVGQFWTIGLAHATISTPFVISAITARLSLFDSDLERAAESLGASRATSIRTVTIPIIRPALIGGALFSFLISFNEIVIALFLIGSSSPTLSVILFQDTQFNFSRTVFAVSCLVSLVTGSLVLIINRLVGIRPEMAR